ncbi:hypothetical protein F2Q70_00030511 [Brassica cretica]|uniref:non-specific serine/threonine protein kinase n=1 Tax=Brassica cretica TaxID=69181 RepID=A0A8S9FM14_BRACR|nr:hypothetical protein F2Q70_00030511 [Brassica cretica]
MARVHRRSTVLHLFDSFLMKGRLTTLQELYASGLTEPIPDFIFQLENLFDLRISDTTLGQFPHITSKNLKYLVLRNMNLTGPIPTTIWDLPNLMTLDLSFNRLTGEIPADATAPKYTYLAGNMLSGKVESGPFLTASTNIDLSYNNFTWSPSCRERTNVNTYESSSSRNRLTRLLPCSAINQCKTYSKSLHINCGGPDVTIENSRGRFLYEGDNSGRTCSATNYHGKNWGFSNTGDFMDDIITEDTYSVSSESPVSAKYPELYQTARRSPLSLAYFAFCFENGSYNVKLHFAEIQFSDEEPYARLATRFFNIYVQAFVLQKKGAFSEILDPKLEGVFDVMEAERMIKVSLLCSNKSPTLRPTMSEVVKMLEGETEIEQIISDPGVYGDELRFKRSSEIGTSSLPSDYLVSIPSSCESAYDLYPLSPESTVFSRP